MNKLNQLLDEIITILYQSGFNSESNFITEKKEILNSDLDSTEKKIIINNLINCTFHIRSYGDLNIKSYDYYDWLRLLDRTKKSLNKTSKEFK